MSSAGFLVFSTFCPGDCAFGPDPVFVVVAADDDVVDKDVDGEDDVVDELGPFFSVFPLLSSPDVESEADVVDDEEIEDEEFDGEDEDEDKDEDDEDEDEGEDGEDAEGAIGFREEDLISKEMPNFRINDKHVSCNSSGKAGGFQI